MTLVDQVDRLSDAEARSILREIVAALDRPTVVWGLRVLAVEQIVERLRGAAVVVKGRRE